MAEKLDLKFSGLATSVNPFSAAPELSALILDNCVLRNPNLIEPRRGYTQTVVNPDGTISRTFAWQGRILSFTAANTLRDFSDGTGWGSAYTQPASNNWAAQTTFAPPDASSPIRMAPAAKGTFFTTSKGVKMADSLRSASGYTGIADAGIPPAPIIDSCFATTKSGYANWLQSGWSAAYRAVLCKYDANNNLIQSAPSAPVFVNNIQVSAQMVQLEFILPANVNGATFIQLYRTLQNNSTTTAGDEMFLVQEIQLSLLTYQSIVWAGIKNAYGAFLLFDGVTDNNGNGSLLLGNPLYTNPSTGAGIQAANALPPLARDLCLYSSSMLYANTTERHSISLQLIGVGGLVSNTSTIIIGGVTYKFGASTDPSTSPPLVTLATGGTPSQNIDSTAQALVTVVNAYNYKNGGNIQAFYLSTADTMPGQMLFVETGIGGSAFTITVGQNSQSCWAPDLSATSVTLTSNNNRTPGKLWWSAVNQPWAVPANNWAIVGAADQAILRIVNIRNTVFIFKQDGLFTLTGLTPSNFSIQPFDPGLVLLAPESIAVVDNKIHCLTNRGYVYVTEAGVSPSMSKPLERDINYYEYNNTSYPTLTFGLAYENEGWAFLALPTVSDTTSCSQQYLFNENNPSWSRYTLPGVTHGCYDPSRQAITWAVGAYLWEERKAFTDADIQDPAPTGLTVGSTSSSSTVTVSGGTVLYGDIITQGGITARVTGVNGATATLDSTYSFSAAAITVSRAFKCQFRTLPWGDGDPTALKIYQDIFFAFRNASFEQAQIGFNSDVTAAYTSVTKPGPQAVGGEGTEVANYIMRVGIPQQIATSGMLGIDLTIQQAQGFWQLEAVRIAYEEATGLSRR